ncbi:hypothetical protein OYC64_007365 [Pagothenia borchgrevinki]|uniref:Uncharacterized protein n=1 Tax=Pagothenia borchgrevinki TaxID=8213 RepID=A0ABD2GS36_PAGBO
MKEMYEKSEKDSEESSSLLETLQENMTELQKDKDQWLEESFQHVVKLEEIALKVVSLSTQVHLDFLIEKMKEKGDTEKVKKLEEMKSKMDQNPRIKSALSYMYGKTAAIGKAAIGKTAAIGKAAIGKTAAIGKAAIGKATRDLLRGKTAE